MAQAEAAWSSYVAKLSSGELPSQAETSAMCSSGLVEVLATLLYDHIQDQLQTVHMNAFWARLVLYKQHQSLQAGLLQALQELAEAVGKQSQQLSAFAQQMLQGLIQQQQQQQAIPGAAAAAAAVDVKQKDLPASTVALLASLCHKHRTAVASIMMATAPVSLPGLLQHFYQQKLQQLCEVIQQQQQQEAEDRAGGSGDSSGGASMSEDSDAGSDSDSGAAGARQSRQLRGSGSPDNIPGAGRPSAALPAPDPDPLVLLGPEWCAEVQGVCSCMTELGLAAASEEAYTRVINSHVLQQLRNAATGELDSAVLPRAHALVCAGPLAFLKVFLGQGSDADLKLQEWQLRLTYLMLETLGGLRSAEMFDIVIDYPDSAPALQDLAVCLQHTNMAGQFAATFKAALQQRLLHAGAATADIIHTYVSTIRAMRLVDKTGLLLDIVSEPIRAYLRSRPDTIRCIVSMLTEHTTDEDGDTGSSLLQELQAQQQQQQGGISAAAAAAAAAAPAALLPSATGGFGGKSGSKAVYNWCVSETEGDDVALRLLEALESGLDVAAEQAEAEAQQSGLLGLPVRPAAAASAALMGAAGLGGPADADVVSMLIGIYGGPLLFMEEYRRMLADRLLAKDEYDCEREICTLELLKIRFGDAGLYPCEVMLKDLADSKRLDANVRALPRLLDSTGDSSNGMVGQKALPPGAAAAMARLRATICSYLFWPDLPEHEMKLPADLQKALEVYAGRFRHLKAPRKLRWRPTLGLVELTVTVGDAQPIDFRVTPVHAALLLQFSDDADRSTAAAAAAGPLAGGDSSSAATTARATKSSTAGQLSTALGVPVPVVRRKAMFWVAAGVLLETRGATGEVNYTRATSIDPGRIVSREVTDTSWQDDSGASSSAEDRIIAEMGPFENYIIGILTNCGTLPLDRLHNMLRVFVVGEPKYEGRSQEQLAAFLQIMANQEKIEVHNGVYSKRKAAA